MSTFEQTTGKTIKQAWWEYHKKNPRVYNLFCIETFKAIKMKKTKLSSKMIINFIRWNMYLETVGSDEYKINDAFTPYYARLFEHEHPQYEGIFEKRRIRSK